MKNLWISTIMKGLLLKKIFVAFLVVTICFNCFIPKSAEFKNNLKEAINCAVETQTNFLDKYADSVVSVTNGIAGNVLNALNKAGLVEEQISKTNKATNKEEEKTEPINTSAENGIIVGNSVNSINTINVLKAKTLGLAYSDISKEQLQCYSDELVKGNDKNVCIGILFFILFSILVVRIKDTIAVLYNNKNIVKEPTWLK